MSGLRESLCWFKHLVVIDCPAGCPYCAKLQLKAEEKSRRLNALERLCLEAMFELGDQAEAVAIVTSVQRRLGRWRLPQIYRCFERLERRELACSRIAPRRTDPVSGAKRLFRMEPTALHALGRTAPVNSFDHGAAQTLAEILRSRDSLSPKEILFIGSGICFEAGCAHRRGITHGDILPQNILVAPDLQVKLINFEAAPDGHPDIDIAQIRDVLHRMSLYAPEPGEIKWIVNAASPGFDNELPSADWIQHRLQGPLDDTYSPPPAYEWLEEAVGMSFMVVIAILYWFMAHPASIPPQLQNAFLNWFS